MRVCPILSLGPLSNPPSIIFLEIYAIIFSDLLVLGFELYFSLYVSSTTEILLSAVIIFQNSRNYYILTLCLIQVIIELFTPIHIIKESVQLDYAII